VLVVVVVLGIVANIGLDAISAADANFRADRAARETLAALRYARWLAMSSGNTCGVEFDTAQKKIKVYTLINGTQTWVTSPFGKSATYLIDLANNSEVANVAMGVAIPSRAANPYDCAFTTLGSTVNTGTVTFTYGRGRKAVTIVPVGDPTLQ
jgi:Tfp pilus assembly protein FimT